MSMLNVGCGARSHWEWNNLDFSPYAYLRRKRVLSGVLKITGFLSAARSSALENIDPSIICHDVCRGLPFPDKTFDVVYHAQFLEHLERTQALWFLKECYRILKPRGIIRVVTPDLEYLAGEYLRALQVYMREESAGLILREQATMALFGQMVRREPVGTQQQKGWVRFVERLVRGNVRKSGELHCWLYDHCELRQILSKAGFQDLARQTTGTSTIRQWPRFNLETDRSGKVYYEHSLFMEGVRK